MIMPPSTLIAWPVIPREASAASMRATAATSSGSIRRFWGLVAASWARASSSLRPVCLAMFAAAPSAMGVST